MESIIVKYLGALADKLGLFPKTHFRERGVMSAVYAIHLLLEKIYGTWQQITIGPKVVSLLLLDIMGAFNFISHKQLLHNLRKRRINIKTVNWLGSFISNHEITLRFDRYI